MPDNDALVNTAWLESHLSAPDVRVVDASWHLPAAGRNAKAEYDEAHIPGAAFFDIDQVCDLESDLPHMMPRAEKMSSRMRKLGLGDGNRIIIYDNSDLRSAARVWYMLKSFGQRDVAILDGGLQKWRAEHRETEDLPSMPRMRHFTARLDNDKIRDRQQMMDNLDLKKEQVVDARSLARFKGTAPEPRESMKSGHIPGSYTLPFGQLLNTEDGTFKSADQIRRIFEQAGIDLSKPVVTSCGSGITACVLSLALYIIGHNNNALYDGSWSDWGLHPHTPVEK